MEDNKIMNNVDLSKALEKGWRSTEFIVTIIIFVIGILVQSGVLGAGSNIENIAALIIEGAAGLGYSASRTTLKKNINSNIGTLGLVKDEMERAATARGEDALMVPDLG